MEKSKLICECCNENEAIGVFSSQCGPISHAYCKDCADAGYEPYGSIVALGLCVEFEDMNEDSQKMILHNLKFYKKTLDEFKEIARVANAEYNIYVES